MTNGENIGQFTASSEWGEIRFQSTENADITAPFTGTVELEANQCSLFVGADGQAALRLCGLTTKAGPFEYGEVIGTASDVTVTYYKANGVSDWTIAAPSKATLETLFPAN